MYRIHFKHNGGFFCVQVMFLGMFWVSVKRDGKIIQHNTFDAATRAVVDLGIHKLYENKSEGKYHQHMSGQTELNYNAAR